MNVEEIRKKVRSLCEDVGLQFFFAVPNASEWAVTDCEHLRKIVSYHKELETLPPVTSVQRWIPVSERLPEKNMRCLVAVGRFNFTEIATYSDLMGIIDHKIFYQGDVGHDSFKNITQYVKAWMPLPEPYKAESEEV